MAISNPPLHTTTQEMNAMMRSGDYPPQTAHAAESKESSCGTHISEVIEWAKSLGK